jgi:hypothetical protein
LASSRIPGLPDFFPAKSSPLYQLYPNVNWTVLFTKLGDLLRKDYDWSKEIVAIKAPTMIVFADADAVRSARVARRRPEGRRFGWFWQACDPAGRFARPTHYNIGSSPVLATVVTPFLDAPLPRAKQGRQMHVLITRLVV